MSGTVYGGGQPLANTQVQAIVPGTSTVVDEDTTDASGHYSLSLGSGTYNLVVTPPDGSGYAASTVNNLLVDQDKSYDVILVAQTNGAVNGLVTGYGGAPLQGVSVNMWTSNWNYVGNTTTDANGAYQFAPGNGNYYVNFSGGGQAGAPPGFNCWFWNLSINGSTTANLPIPVAHLSGTVTGIDGPAVPGVNISASGSSGAILGDWSRTCSASGSATTDANGQYLLALLVGSAQFNLSPPSSSGYASQSVNRNITGDSEQGFILPFPSKLAGVVTGRDGAPVSGAWVTLYTNSWQHIGSTSTDASGAYSFLAGDGGYYVNFNGSAGSAGPGSFNCWKWNATISGTTALDLPLPVAQLSGAVTGEDGSLVAGASLRFDSSGPVDGDWSFSCSGSTDRASGEGGAYSALVFQPNVMAGITPPSGSPFAATTQHLSISGDTVRDFVLPLPRRFGGVVTGRGGAPVPNVWVSVYTNNWQWRGSVATDSSGAYAFQLAPGGYYVNFSGGSSPPGATSMSCWNWAAQVGSADTVLDVPLSIARIDQRFTDSNGAPVKNVQVNSNGSAPINGNWSFTCSSWIGGSSDEQGNVSALVVSGGDRSFNFIPPQGSGFQMVSLNKTVTGDLTQAVILHRPDGTAPQIVSGPTVIHLSDDSVSISWVTNEASTSVVQYGTSSALGQSASSAGFTINHTVTLLGLTPQTPYYFRVGSKDASHNGPTWSEVGTFTSQAPPGDITPPVVSGLVVFPQMTNAIVQWQTDEPATTVVHFGAGNALDQTVSDAAFTQHHSIALTGLTPGATYSVKAASIDPDGNGPTFSAVQTFQTLTEARTEPPVITAGPDVLSVTDTTITVTWTTDVPSNSGVSFNDGTRYDLVNDPALVTSHSVTISGLTPQTTWHVRVSSTDALGNGPTVGGPIDVTTLATPDTAPPQFTEAPVASAAKTTATIGWTTDEPSTTRVRYGTSPGSYDNEKADLQLVSGHTVLLTGLQPGTTYYLKAFSTDASGNEGSAVEITFTTTSDAPKASCVGTQSAPVVLATAAGTCGAAIDATNAGSCSNGTCSFDGQPSATLGPGDHAVAVVATSPAGLTDACTSYVRVSDGEAPAITCPAGSTVECSGALTAAQPAASCSDACGCNAWCAAGSYALGGAYPVSCQAADGAGNQDACTTSVTVVDTTSPSIAVSAAPRVLWPPNHKMVPIALAMQVGDACDPQPAVSCQAVSSEAANNFQPDIAWVGGRLWLRAERFGNGPGRVYTITCTATDASGNVEQATTTVEVPHDRR